MQEELERAGSRGHHALAAAVLSDGEPAFAGWAADGPAPDERTLFEIGSITKPFTGVLLADMHLRGEVDIADPLSRHLPGPGPAWRSREPTLLELATHRSGLPNTPRALARRELALSLGIGDRDPWGDVDEARYRELLRQTSPRRPRGRGFRYSSLGFGLLGDALAHAAGRPYEELLRERVLEPLGMHDTAIAPSAPVTQGHTRRGKPAPPLEDLMPAAGGLRSNLTDMTTFLAACLAPGPDPPGPALALARQRMLRLDGGLSIGLGWLIVAPRGQATRVWHNGGTWGFRSFAGFGPDRRRGAVVLSDTSRSVDRLGLSLLDGPRRDPC